MSLGLFILLCSLAGALLFAVEPALAQCAMCRTTVENSADAASIAKTLNAAILVLLLPSVAIMGTILVVAFRSQNSGD